MIKFENIKVYNIGDAINGMRNPLESWSKSDSDGDNIGTNDMNLAKRLVKSGPSHRKFLRQIMVSMTIVAPSYWWKEMDQYRVGVTTNSTSTMHKLSSTPLTVDNFSSDLIEHRHMSVFKSYIRYIDKELREKASDDKEAFNSLIQMLPSSFNYTKLTTMNYEVLYNIYHTRKNHKLKEWNDFCIMIEELPFSDIITISE